MIKQGTYIVTLHISVFPEFRKRDREAAWKRTATDIRTCAGRSGQRVSTVLGALRLAEVVLCRGGLLDLQIKARGCRLPAWSVTTNSK